MGDGFREDGSTSGPGGIGSLPSSRLTRILQEKAEALKKKRQTGEQIQKEAEERVALLERLGILPPEAGDRAQRVRDLARRSDWDSVETEAKALLDYLAKSVPTTIEDRRKKTIASIDRLSGSGVLVPPELRTELEALGHPAADAAWTDTVGRLVAVEEGLKKAEAEYVRKARDRAQDVARWAGLSGEALQAFVRRLDAASAPAEEGRLAEANDAILHLLRTELPEAVQRRQRARETAEKLVEAAKEHAVSPSKLEAALRADNEADPEQWPETVSALEVANTEVGETLRDRAGQVLEALRTTLTVTPEFGVDAGPAKQAVEEAIARLPTLPPLEIASLVSETRRVAEEPIVAVVAGLLDEVRPRITEARRLGRDPSDVFAAMNRAREALRLKIYSEALAASQEALDRVAQLTEDLETVQDELTALDELLARFRLTGFSSEPFDAAIAKARGLVEHADVGAARSALHELVLQVGREAFQFFVQRWGALDKVKEYARERGFLPDEAERALGAARQLLDKGDFAGGAEEIARAEVELRKSAAPYMARRIEEMEQGFADIPDETLTAPVRRSLADADVTLRVKGDLPGAIDSLKRAERDFASVFATHASALVEMLEDEGRILESMGGASDEIQRQIDEVQQIFNMGDFVKASRASQEIRTRAQQQQLLRSEEAVSHAKLSLVELETMGLDLAKFRVQLDEAQAAARASRYPEAYKLSSRLEEQAVRTRANAQTVLEGINQAQDLLARLRDAGGDPGPYYEPLRNVRLAFQALDLDGARTQIDAIALRLRDAQAHLEVERLMGDLGRLLEDGRRLSAPMEPFAARFESLKTELATAPVDATVTGARILHEELIGFLRPILDENLRGLERDLDIARAAGVDVEKILGPLSEARRRVALPVPAGAASLLDTARTEFISTRGFVEHAERIAKRAREALAEADLLHVDIGGLRAQMERVEQALAARQYARVIEIGGPLEREFSQVTYQHVSKTLAHFQATVTRLHREGGETAVAENLLHQARMALDEGRPVEALQLAGRSESELERADLQRRLAEGSLEATERSIARARADGVVATTAQDEFGAARTAFQQRQYPEVLERAIAASETLQAAREGHRRARDALASAEAQIAEAASMGAEVIEAGARFAEAREAVEKGQYSVAVRAAREAVERGRWAIERLFARPLGELRGLLEAARKEGLGPEIDPVEAVLGQAEAALRAREWAQVREAVERAESSSRRVFEAVLDGRWREVVTEFERGRPSSPAEGQRREAVQQDVRALRERKEYGAALALVRSELDLARRQRREAIEATAGDVKDRLWVGERLGVDTTPMMQTFSEAKSALDAFRLDEADRLFAKALEALKPAVQDPFERRAKELQSEVTFAQEGLHVSVGPIRDRLREIEELQRNAHLLEAARQLLAAEEDLALRKSLHRELMNLHYLIDAALARAHERRLDTTEARQLLSESIRLRDQDYAQALAKAREALRKLQEEGAVPPTEAAAATPAPAPATSALWPFRRPPTEP
ncbi:MAG TPA: hypothetical protein VMG81_03870 [Thermoplasmata archaeon]|nr:hypothetical protein [Thermoplasmata archaeon]